MTILEFLHWNLSCMWPQFTPKPNQTALVKLTGCTINPLSSLISELLSSLRCFSVRWWLGCMEPCGTNIRHYLHIWETHAAFVCWQRRAKGENNTLSLSMTSKRQPQNRTRQPCFCIPLHTDFLQSKIWNIHSLLQQVVPIFFVNVSYEKCLQWKCYLKCFSDVYIEVHGFRSAAVPL